MPAPSSFERSDMIQSMKVKIHPFLPFTHEFSKTDINSFALGQNMQMRLTNSAMRHHLKYSNLSDLKPLMVVTPNYTQLIQQSSSAGVSLYNNNTYTYIDGTSIVVIDPGNGSNLLNSSGTYFGNANGNMPIYAGGLYSSQGEGLSYQAIVTDILNSFVNGNKN